MNWIAQLTKSLFASWRAKAKRAWESFRPPMRIELVTHTLPARLARRKLYVVREDGYYEQAAMICPCGCKQVLHMNLLTDERPCWVFRGDKNGVPTLHPSVWRQKGCGSHFWLQRGRIIWC